MTLAQEKAQELVDKCRNSPHQILMTSMAKYYALIAVDEILNAQPLIPSKSADYYVAKNQATKFWIEVKKEIESI